MKKNMSLLPQLSRPSSAILAMALLLVSLPKIAQSSGGNDLTTLAGATNPHFTTLSNGKSFPMIGIGAGNLEEDVTISQISRGISEFDYRLIDTAHNAGNEGLVMDGIMDGVARNGHDADENSAPMDIHVVTKVWYTHLGYERTKLSVRESFQAFKEAFLKYRSLGNTGSSSRNYNAPVRVHVHMLLHWPRCRDDLDWMDCEGEEEMLPQYVKDAGPAPHLDKESAYLESWRALEDFYLGDVSLWEDDDGNGNDLYKDRIQLASIGVSNFDQYYLKGLVEHEKTRVIPHMLQLGVWSHFYEKGIVQLCTKYQILYQAYNVMQDLINTESFTPNAHQELVSLAEMISLKTHDYTYYTIFQVVLKWMVENGVSVVAKTTDVEHLRENSPLVVLDEMPYLEPSQHIQVKYCLKYLLRDKDLPEAMATFINNQQGHPSEYVDNQGLSSLLHIFWYDESSGEEIPVKENLEPGEAYDVYTHAGHVFVAYNASKTKRKEFKINTFYGQQQFVIPEL